MRTHRSKTVQYQQTLLENKKSSRTAFNKHSLEKKLTGAGNGKTQAVRHGFVIVLGWSTLCLKGIGLWQ